MEKQLVLVLIIGIELLDELLELSKVFIVVGTENLVGNLEDRNELEF